RQVSPSSARWTARGRRVRMATAGPHRQIRESCLQMSDLSHALDGIMESVRENFVSKNAARERALPLCRDSIRFSANAIRAVHRNDFETARALVGQSGE